MAVTSTPRRPVLIADDDATTRTVLQRMLRDFGYPVIEAKNGPEALQLASARDSPHILLLDWVMPGLDGIDVCRLLRARDDSRRRYMLLVTSRSSRRDMLAGLAAGADDFLTKPVPPDVLRARLRVAERSVSLGAKESDPVYAALVAAKASPGGELVVRADDIVGRVFLHAGRIAWAHVGNEPVSLTSVVQTEIQLAATDAEAVLRECRQSGRNFGDVLVSWGLVDQVQLRESVRLWVSRKLATILAFDNAEVMFIPHERKFSGDLLFTLSELLPARPLPTAEPAIPSIAPPSNEAAEWSRAFVASSDRDMGAIAGVLEEVMAIEGAVGAALLDRTHGVSLGRAGDPISADIVWAHLSALNTHGRAETVEDVIVRTDKGSHVLCAVPSQPSLCLYLRLGPGDTVAAMARVLLHGLAARLADTLDRLQLRPSDLARLRPSDIVQP